MQKKLTFIYLIIFIAFFMLTGCQNKAEKRPIPPNKSEEQVGLTDSESRVLSSRISNLAIQVEGVNRASVVVVRTELSAMDFVQNKKTNDTLGKLTTSGGGITVIVGASVNANIRENPETLSKTITNIKEKTKLDDVEISQILVTTDPAIIGKIDALAVRMMEGEPITQYKEEIKEIIKEINPQK
ncbi:MAG TPA: YhcN/YlaJ family sporulation lipoprotein [Syntrophomonadaceae bacterium]|nr:YhcN/YlaJ family sporulation lipoprotein [Syntrophomonadaceae bacterium]